LAQFVEPRLKQQADAHAAEIREIRSKYDKEIAGLKAEMAELRARLDAKINEHHLSKTHELERKRSQRIITDMQYKVDCFMLRLVLPG
jgi:Skp family chaperone for outer membrane proteins